MKRQADKRRKEIEEWKKGDKVMLSTKDLVFKKRPVRKLVEKFIEPYKIKEVEKILNKRKIRGVEKYLV